MAFSINMYSAKFTAGPEVDATVGGTNIKKEP